MRLLIVSVALQTLLTKSTYLGSMPKLASVQMRSWLCVVAVFLLSTILYGCASLASRGLLPEVKARRPPEVDLGAELILLNEPVRFSTSLISTDGRAHVFVTNAKRQLQHIEIVGDKILTREFLGVFETARYPSLDAVEHPPGRLRVLVGDRQYVRTAPERDWQEVKGNRCTRFVPIGNDLFCAFVVKGEEVGAPKRTDVTVGLFILVPVVFWSDKQASKLVMAKESEDGWIICAVLDPETPRDADRDFVVGTDSLGTLHFLYGASRGGGVFVVAAAGYADASGFLDPPLELRYAQMGLDRLLALPMDPRNQGLIPGTDPRQWVPIQGTSVPQMPSSYTGKILWGDLRPFDRHFAVNKVSGEVSGLMRVDQGRLDDGTRKLTFKDLDNAWVEVGIQDRRWTRRFDVIAAKNLPDSTHSWLNDGAAMIKSDPRGNIHALLQDGKMGFWKSNFSMGYLLKNGSNWSAPLILGNRRNGSDSRTLAMDDSGGAFATWVNKEGSFVGRWIRPRGRSLP